MKISIITLFPEVFQNTLNFSIIGRAVKRQLVEFEIINLRDFGIGVHQVVDDRPYGGGVGMVLKADVLASALGSVARVKSQESRVLLTSASGKQFNQKKARELYKLEHLIIICGHYEGIDQRFIDKYVDEEISIGDYVLTGGELPALVVSDAVIRLLKGVLLKEEATQKESFEDGLLEHAHYTRPEVFEGEKVPEILLSGDHAKVDAYRQQQSVEKTEKLRPDLLLKRVKLA